jgi:hypothetical protein
MLALIVILSLSASTERLYALFPVRASLAMKAIVSLTPLCAPPDTAPALVDSVAMSSKRGRAAADGTAQEFRRHKSGVNEAMNELLCERAPL